MTRAWVVVDNADGDLVSAGPIMHVTSASVTRALNGPGRVRLAIPATDQRGAELLTLDRYMNIYVKQPGEALRLLGVGIIADVSTNDSDGSKTITAEGPDLLHELTRISTGFARGYDYTLDPTHTVAYVVGLLAALVDGWTGSSTVTDGVIIDYSWITILKALQDLLEQTGLMLRLSAPGTRTVEVGSFGDVASVRLVNVGAMHREIYDNTDIAVIESVSVASKTEDVVSQITPLASGGGNLGAESLYDGLTAGLQAEYSSDGYQLNIASRTDRGGIKEWYIEKYGWTGTVVENTPTFATIAYNYGDSAVTVGDKGLLLYAAAVAWLNRMDTTRVTYTVRTRKCVATIKPGDKAHVRYQGVVQLEDTGDFIYQSINADLWVLSVTETVGLEGLSTSFELSAQDAYDDSAVPLRVARAI